MIINQRPFRDSADYLAMANLVNSFPADNLHVADLPYRFSSWAMDHPENIQLWTDEQDALLGWAVMQTPFWTIDYAYHPEANIHPQILAWVDGRAKAIEGTSSGRPIWFINVFTTQIKRISELEAAGFASQADVGDNSWTKVLMKCPGEAIPVESPLPDGFTIRPLAGEREVDAYVDLHQAVFQSKSMTAEWRQRTLQQPAYKPEIDLVAVSPDDRLAAFCICWLKIDTTGKTIGQVEPLGVSDEFRELGLGRAILSEGIRRLQSLGAESIYVETDNYRDGAFALYESAGLRVAREVFVYRRDYGEL